MRLTSSLVIREIKDNFRHFYTVTKKIGEGTFSVVHNAWKNTTKNEYSIKEMSMQKKGNSLLNCLKEINLTKSLDHPNIIKLIEYYTIDKESVSIVEECVKGGDLFSLISAKKKIIRRRSI